MKFNIQTKGHYDFIDITNDVRTIVKQSDISEGIAVIFITSSTVALTTMEYEDGVIKDIKQALEKLAPENADYQHHRRWGDHNGAAHIKSALIGTDLVVPIVNKKLQLSTWQQLVLIDFDEKPRSRQVIVKVIKQ